MPKHTAAVTVLKALHFASSSPPPLLDLRGLPLAPEREPQQAERRPQRPNDPAGERVPAAHVWFVLAKCLLPLHIVSAPRPDRRCQIALLADWLAFFFFYFLSGFQALNRCNLVL